MGETGWLKGAASDCPDACLCCAWLPAVVSAADLLDAALEVGSKLSGPCKAVACLIYHALNVNLL